MMYRVIIGRCHDNPLTGKAQYRVLDCWEPTLVYRPVIYERYGDIGLLVTKPYQVGSYINPTRALKETLSVLEVCDGSGR